VKDYKQLIKELDNLHETRSQMSYCSIYHGQYIDIAIDLNAQLVELTGFDYNEHKAKERSQRVK
jgi:hypothetical protein